MPLPCLVCLHPPNVPLHALPLRLARRQQVPDVAEVGDVPVALELGARVAPGLVARRPVRDPPRAPEYVPVEGQDARALEELHRPSDRASVRTSVLL